MNCAAEAAPTYFFTSSDMRWSRCGDIMAGMLKEAKMVRQSRTVKSANVGSGTGRAVEDVEPNICVKRLSL